MLVLTNVNIFSLLCLVMIALGNVSIKPFLEHIALAVSKYFNFRYKVKMNRDKIKIVIWAKQNRFIHFLPYRPVLGHSPQSKQEGAQRTTFREA